MKSPKTFQIVIIGVFLVLLIFGFLGFSGKLDSILPSSGKKDINYGEVTLWGTIPSSAMQQLIAGTLRDVKSVTIKYVEKSAATFDRDFVEALASGIGPDMVLIPQDEILKKLNKLTTISYQTIPERDFKNTFLEEGEMFLRPTGIVALPFIIDPIIMYWNRDIFTNAFLSSPPSTWSEFYDLAPKITVRDRSENITRSLVAFGEYRNVSNAKEIVSIMMMQAGSPIVLDQNGALSAALVTASELNVENPVITAIRFFTEFSKVDKTSYSWNRSLPASRTAFESGDLALYFGYASEYKSILQKNPHLNFDVAMVPQAKDAPTKLTFGRMQGLAIVRAGKNPQGALYAARLLSSKEVVAGMSAITGLPPVRKDLISLRPSRESADSPTGAEQTIFYNSALIARAWQDPSSAETNTLFMTMIDDITTGRLKMTEALGVAQNSMKNMLQAYR
ncbi:MAG: extracellular solute-binding protein [Patescibacteria group bacterium]